MARMLLLSIDTSGKSGGITLAQGDQGGFRVLESVPIAGGTFSAQLVPTLAALLQKHGFTAGDIGGFVAVSGPGSFTGLRVGLSAVKGLAEVLQKPIATVSLLEALAVLSGKQGKVVTALDAGREEVYCGMYEVMGTQGSRTAEHLLSNVEFLGKIRDENSDQIITSDEAIVQLVATAGIGVQKMERPESEGVARIGLQKLLAGETVGVEELDANYIRRSDAEIFSSGRHRSGTPNSPCAGGQKPDTQLE
jgi:tRNA threonylcarbamoyladenosine biosynthesis protein TsaB